MILVIPGPGPIGLAGRNPFELLAPGDGGLNGALAPLPALFTLIGFGRMQAI